MDSVNSPGSFPASGSRPGTAPEATPSARGALAADDHLMGLAIEQARTAGERPRPDVPIGAVVIDRDGTVIARAGNRREADEDPTAHAEILALREAARVAGRWNLSGCTLVVTLEPCTMCAGAIVLSRVDRVVYGATDPKAGAAGSLYDLVREPRLNHRAEVTAGVRAQECGDLLRDFFRARRRGAIAPGRRTGDRGSLEEIEEIEGLAEIEGTGELEGTGDQAENSTR